MMPNAPSITVQHASVKRRLKCSVKENTSHSTYFVHPRRYVHCNMMGWWLMLSPAFATSLFDPYSETDGIAA